MDRRALLARLLEPPELEPLLSSDTGPKLLEKLVLGVAHDLYAKSARPIHDDGSKLAHDARVATRRLAEALELAAPLIDSKDRRRIDRRTKRLRQMLGEKRIADVLLADLRDLLQNAGIPEPEGLLGFQRIGAASLAHVIDAFPPERLLKQGVDLLGLIESPRRDDLSLLDIAGPHLYRRLAEIEPLAGSISDRRALETHHRLRIRIKRLRYTVEILAVPFPEVLGSDEIDGTLKRLQKALGELNDAKDLVLWLHDRELVDLLHPELCSELIVRARAHLDRRYEHALEVVGPALSPLVSQLRKAAVALDQT